MSLFEVRSKDEALKRALTVWYEEKKRSFEDMTVIVTDIDSMPPTGEEGEITCSYGENACLRRPFSFARLEELLFKRRAQEKKRLILYGERFYLDGAELSLTARETAILTALYRAQEPQSEKELALALGEKQAPRSNKIAAEISYLRSKTEAGGRPRLILTARSKGYYIKNG